jgi:hypothetical protein
VAAWGVHRAAERRLAFALALEEAAGSPPPQAWTRRPGRLAAADTARAYGAALVARRAERAQRALGAHLP